MTIQDSASLMSVASQALPSSEPVSGQRCKPLPPHARVAQ